MPWAAVWFPAERGGTWDRGGDPERQSRNSDTSKRSVWFFLVGGWERRGVIPAFLFFLLSPLFRAYSVLPSIKRKRWFRPQSACRYLLCFVFTPTAMLFTTLDLSQKAEKRCGVVFKKKKRSRALVLDSGLHLLCLSNIYYYLGQNVPFCWIAKRERSACLYTLRGWKDVRLLCVIWLLLSEKVELWRASLLFNRA